MEEKGLFDNFKCCEVCKRPLPLAYNDTLCPFCRDHQLFRDVKEYIRQNDVTEFDVAEHFDIPLHRVKQWIRDGRIEYRDEEINAKFTMHCERCGAPIAFGSLCSKCLKAINASGHSAAASPEASKMRYLENVNKKK